MSDIIPNVVVSMPSQQFTLARKFQAASNGKIYIGKIDTDPTIPENQIQVYLENEDGSTIPVAQPLIINQAGFPVYNGQIAKFVTVEGHSMAVYDSYGAQQFYYPNVLKYDPDQFKYRLEEGDGYKNIGSFSSISELRQYNASSLNTGSRVLVDSYIESKGYGGGFFRYDADNTDADDGVMIIAPTSGVGRFVREVLDNQLYISYEIAGADITGIEPSEDAIVRAHSVANSLGVQLKQNRGKFRISKSVEVSVKTDVDLKGSEFVFDDNLNINKVFNVKPTVNLIEANVNNQNFVNGNTVVPELAIYENAVVSINSKDIDIYRNGDRNSPVYKRDIVEVRKGGTLSHPLIYTMTTQVSVVVNQLEKSKLIFNAPSITIGNSLIASFVYSTRNDVTVNASGVKRTDDSIVNRIITYFEPHNCRDNVLDAIAVDNSNHFETASAYGISGGSVIRQGARNYHGAGDWGLMDGNTIRDGFATDITAARVGVHAQAFNFTAERCTLKEKAIQISGRGTLKVSDCKKFCVGVGGTSGYVNTLIDLRADYGSEWVGDIIVDNPELNCGDLALTDAETGIVRLHADNIDFGREVFYPRRIIINGGSLTASTNSNAAPNLNVVELFRYPTSQTTFSRKLPQFIKIVDLNVRIPAGSGVVRINPVRLPGQATTGFYGDMSVEVTGNIFPSSIPTAVIARTGITLNVDIADIYQATTGYTANFTFNNSIVDAVFVSPSSFSLTLNSCDTLNVDGYTGEGRNGKGIVCHNASRIRAGRYSGGGVTHMYLNSLFKAGAGNIELSGGIARASGNSIEKNAQISFAVGDTKERLVYGYYNGSKFEPTA
ncbi:phage tailspike protein [Providencia sp. TYF-12]|uniref:phage tailspike protein n=1 Tax=unclassified Providencia TaxID=2633465 RepID=UPI0035256DF8